MIFNPASGRGRGRRRLSTYRRLLEAELPNPVIVETQKPGDETELTDRALSEGFDVVVAVGGDGTWSNVAHRIVGYGSSSPVLGLLPNGTGNDFGRNLGFDPDGPAEAVRALAAGRLRTVDVGLLETPSAPEHAPDRFEPRHFLNLVGFGFDIAVIDAAARARFLKGALLYKLSALGQLFRFPGVSLGVAREEEEVLRGRCLMLTISNGCFFGGGFPIAPGAAVDDGLLHACRIEDAAPLRRLRLFNLAERGQHRSAPEVEVLGGKRFRVSFERPPRFELDGEVRIAADRVLEIQVAPASLRVIAP